MDDKFWETFAADADSNYNEEFAKFIRDLALSLRCASILEVGCNAGNDLRLFDERVAVYGIDYNPKIVDLARTRSPSFDFRAGSATALPFEDSSIDLVFTHGFMNYLENENVDAAVSEIFRVAVRYVVHCERLEDGTSDGIGYAGRDMLKRWMNYKVKIISNVEMHGDIDPAKPMFLLARKI